MFATRARAAIHFIGCAFNSSTVDTEQAASTVELTEITGLSYQMWVSQLCARTAPRLDGGL